MRVGSPNAGGNRAGPDTGRLRVAFVMCTEVGLKTQYLNWRRGLTPDLGVDPVWIPIDWWQEGGLLERLPGVPGGVKARLRARLQLSRGMAEGPFDALLVAGHTVPGIGPYLARQPYFVTLDVTARQLAQFGDLYGKTGTGIRLIEARKERARRQVYRHAAALFPWSNWAAASLVEDYGVDPTNVHVIPPGVDVAAWRCPEREQGGPVRILFVGGDFARKGGDLLLEWAARTSLQNWELHLVTRDPVPATDPRVKVHHGLSPNSPELLKLYRDAHVFALPTRGDCYSLATIEAMAAGLPVILSDTGGTADIVKDAETGYLIPIGDAEALAGRLEALLDDPALRQRMGQAARADAEARYDGAGNVREAVEAMRAALSPAAGRAT